MSLGIMLTKIEGAQTDRVRGDLSDISALKHIERVSRQCRFHETKPLTTL